MPQPHTGELVPSGQQLWTFDNDGNLIVANQFYTGGVPDPTKPGPGQPLVPGTAVAASFPGGGGTLDWINVKAAPYNAQSAASGTPTVDATAAIQAALNACPAGGVVYFPNGLYLVSSPITIPNGVTLLGPDRAQQGAGSDSPLGAVLVPATNFPGQGTYPVSAVLQCFGSSVTGLPSGTPVVSNYVRIINMGVSRISGRTLTNEVDGIAAYGNVAGSSILGCFVFGMENNIALYNDATDGVSPDGWQLQDIVCANAANYDFNLYVADLTAINCHVQEDGNGNGAWIIYGANGNNRLIGCRGDGSGGPGFTLIGPSGSGGGGANSGDSDSITLSACGSQGNQQQAVLILDNYTGGSTPAPSNVIINGGSFDQDGGAGGSGTDYAGIEVNGLAVVKIANTNINVDTGGGASGGGPQYGIKTSASASGGRVPILVSIEQSLISCSVQPFYDGAPAANWYIGSGVQTFIGTHTSHITAANIVTAPEHAWTAPELGFVAQSFDLATASPNVNTRLITAQVLNLIGLRVRHPATVSTVDLQLIANGATLTSNECFVGLYSSAGTLLGYSADQSTAWGSGAAKTISTSLTAESARSLSLLPGLYRVALLGNGTTMPSFQSGANELTVNANGRLTASTARYATSGSGLTALPSSITPSSNTLTSVTWWAGLY
jgi:hypothetical protein